MNYDEFSFFNHQLAAMLRDGLPLEGALRHLAKGMRAGRLRVELQELEADLARGTPLKDALGRRELPDFYRRMVALGVQSNDLPGVLILLADHYQRAYTLTTRLKGLLFYPFIVILLSLALSLTLSLLSDRFLTIFAKDIYAPSRLLFLSLWVPPLALAATGLAGLLALTRPRWRAQLRWRLPAFREASLAQLASAMALMLRNGTTLAEALALAESLESASPAAPALSQWRYLVEAGQGKPTLWHRPSRPFPPLFVWLVQTGGEDTAAGFQKAAEIYQARASYRIELALFGALPVAILFLGQTVLWQIVPLVHSLTKVMNSLGL